MRTRPVEYFGHFLPVVHFLERHLLYRSACDDHAIVEIILHLVEIFIKLPHVFDRCVLGSMALYLHKVKLHLQGSITQEADKVCLRRDLQRHQVQHNHT